MYKYFSIFPVLIIENSPLLLIATSFLSELELESERMRVEVRVAQLELMSKLKIKYPLLEKVPGNTRPVFGNRRDSLDTNFTEISFPSIENLEKNRDEFIKWLYFFAFFVL